MDEKLACFLAWVVFFLIHSGLASGKIKRWVQKRWIPFRYYRLFYNALSILFLLPVGWVYARADDRVWMNTGLPGQIAGVLLILLSLVLWRKSFENYSLSEFAGTDRLSKDYQLKPRLRTGGLNRLVRHPLYAISYLFLAGVILLSPTYLNAITAISIGLYFPLGIYFEEKKLSGFFGDAYQKYRRHTPALFPWKMAGLLRKDVPADPGSTG